jgi:hypothetical protein
MKVMASKHKIIVFFKKVRIVFGMSLVVSVSMSVLL